MKMITLGDVYRRTLSPKQLPRKALRRLEDALDLLDEEKYDEGYLLLLELVKRFPESEEVLSVLVELGAYSEDWSLVARYGNRLLPYLRGEDRAALLSNLIFAYSHMVYPGLAYEAIQALLAQHPEFVETDKIRSLTTSIEQFLDKEAANLTGEAGLSSEEQYAVVIANDWVRFHLESGEYEDVLRVGEPLIARMPRAFSVHNNVSVAHFHRGRAERAIGIAEQVLERMPDNFHALGNLTRYAFLTAQFDKAEVYAARLKQVRHGSSDLEAKVAEALAYLGDDEGVRAAYRRAKRKSDMLSPLLLHLAAAAHYRLGEERAAWRLWEETLKKNPLMRMAQECLDERFEEKSYRELSWYWPLSYWFPTSLRDDLEPLLADGARKVGDKRFERKLKQILKNYPYVGKLIPHILDRGDGAARQFAFYLAQGMDSEELAKKLYAFAQGPHGSDMFRMEVMQYLAQTHPELVPSEGTVRMWANGKEQDLVLLNYEVYFEGKPPEGRPQKLIEKDIRAMELLTEERAEEAEELLKEIIEADPEFPTSYNQLAVAYDMQGRRDEALSLGREILERFPDYFFARANMARILALEGRVDEARALIEPLLAQKRMHITEFKALAQAQMELLLAEKNRDAARSWLNMWSELEGEEEPNVVYWRRRIDGPRPDEMNEVIRDFLRRQSRRR